MAFIPVPNTVEMTLRAQVFGQECVNTQYATLAAGVPTAAQVEEVCAAWRDVVLDHLNLWHNQTTFIEVHGRDLSTDDGPVADISFDAGVTGSVSSGALPNNVSLAIQFRSGVAGRSNRGRNYLFGIAETYLADANHVTSVFANAVHTYYGDVGSAIVAAGFEWVIVSRYHDGAPRVSGQVLPINSHGFADFTIDSQRRRLPGRGR
jgi:hypothetical protein